ncbi:protein phosphatase 2C domain-containing protein [Streptomyces pinistramenti]|uniref:protein phosphatase 2C domain-containing protein n=1 Tax=Streptomyces pinistramenti TaxID=2884812 RepID=UPI001D08D3E8|nr:protein phosphatase 2C domain-containing protein [Streptomyces pinistramenti]MCB5906676.1 protein phosphatase 2C domain-containing protein [Streptomyces pinistramenti]
MGVTGPSRCPSCGKPLDRGDRFCGRCGAGPAAAAAPGGRPADGTGRPPGYGPPPPVTYAPPDTVLPPAPGMPLPDPYAVPPQVAPWQPGLTAPQGAQAAASGPEGEVPGAVPPPQAPPADEDPATPPAPPAPADPRVAGYEAVADAAGQPQTPVRGTRVCAVCRAAAVDIDGYCTRCGQAQPRERDHLERELAGSAAVSDRGHRHHRNEDFFALTATALPDGAPAVVAVVCDGVSSATRPDEASEAASGAASDSLLASLPRGVHPQQALHEAIVTAAAAVNALAVQDEAGQEEHRRQNAPACTLVGAVVGGGLLTVGWVGDSRAYWIPDDRTVPPARLTEDDSWAAQMVANNLMSEAEAMADERAHAITGWLGADAYEVEPHTQHFQPDGPGVVVVCTDGLWNYAETAAQLAAVLPADTRERPLDSARTLVTHALDGGGHDNVTVAVVPFPVPSGGTSPA